MPIEKRCEWCVSWVFGDVGLNGDDKAKYGECRLGPPEAVKEGLARGRFPLTLDKDWCGAFVSAESLEDTGLYDDF
jgi:hypothetical protein